MLLLELAVQSVRGFSPSARVALKPGLIGLKSPTEQPAPLGGLLTALCFPDGRAGEATFLAPGQRTGKAGFSFQANDSTVWRLVRDLGGQGALHRLNAASKVYEVVTQDATEIQQQLRQAVGLPPRTTFDQLFTVTPLQFPTRRPKKKTEEEKKAAARKKVALDIAGEEKKVAVLKNELLVAREMGEVQFRMDGLSNDLYKLEARRTAMEEMKTKLDAARAELANAPTPERLGFPADIVDRVKRYEDEKKKHKLQLAKAIAERDQAVTESSPASVPSVFKDTRFPLAIVVGLGCLIAGAMTDGGLRYLALAAIAPFSFAALLALRYIEDLQAASRNMSKGDVHDVRIKRIEDEWGLFEAQVNGAMEAVNVATRDDFFVAMQKPEQLKTSVAEIEVAWAEMQVDPDNQALPERITALRAETDAANAKLMEQSGGYVRSEAEITREIARIEENVERAREQEVAQFSAVPAVPQEIFDDPTPPLVLLGADLFACDVPALWAQLKDRTVQYLTALTDRRYFGAEVERDGKAFVLAAGRKVPVTELPGKDLDLWYLAMRLTLVEKYSVKQRVPVVVEDGLIGIVDDAKLPLLTRMLKHLGTLTQVLHVTGLSREPSADPGSVVAV